MNQQQNQQPSNELQKQAEAELSATFAMPPIRTMADDLLEVSRGVTVPVSAEIPATPPKVVSQPVEPAISSVSKQPVAPQRQPVTKSATPPAPIQVQKMPVGNTVAMPNVSKESGKKSFLISMFVGVGVALIMFVAVLAGYIYWPKKTNTIADKIPADAVAFVSIKRGSGALEMAVLPKILDAMGLSSDAIGSKWNDLAYVVIPGSTASESVGFLMIDDASAINLGDNSNHVLKNLANGNTAIVLDKDSGRLDGLSDKGMGDNADFRVLSKKLPASPEYIYFGSGESASMLSSFALLTKEQSPAQLFAVTPSVDGGKFLPVMVAKSVDEKFNKNQLSWEMLIKAIPVSNIALSGYGSLSEGVDKWRQSQSNNPQMQTFLNALNGQDAVIEALRANLGPNFIVGSLVNASPIPDGIAVMPIKDGTTALVQAQMTNLEDVLKLLGPLVGGAPYDGVVFEEANYRDVVIRYVNFGDARRSIDYAIVDSLLLVSTSKTSIEQMIDAYKGDVENFSAKFTAQSTGQVDWQYIRMDEKVLNGLPVSLKTMLSGVTSTYFEPVKEGVYTGNIAY